MNHITERYFGYSYVRYIIPNSTAEVWVFVWHLFPTSKNSTRSYLPNRNSLWPTILGIRKQSADSRLNIPGCNMIIGWDNYVWRMWLLLSPLSSCSRSRRPNCEIRNYRCQFSRCLQLHPRPRKVYGKSSVAVLNWQSCVRRQSNCPSRISVVQSQTQMASKIINIVRSVRTGPLLCDHRHRQ